MTVRFHFGAGVEPAERRQKTAALGSALTAALLIIFIGVCPASGEHFYSDKFDRRTNATSATLHSQILGREIHYSIYLPPSYFEQPVREYPVIYYLHGFDTKGVGYQDWLTWHLDELLDGLIAAGAVREMVVVMPECFASGIVVNWGRYPPPRLPPPLTFPFRLLRGACRSAAEPTYLGTYLFLHRWDLTRSDYADFLTTEFFRHIEENYRVKGERNFRAVCGFSTGGHSALSIAFQNADLFDSVSAHAPILVSCSPFSRRAGEAFVEFDPKRGEFVAQRFTINLLRRIFANEETWRANNPIDLARGRAFEGLSMYIDVAEGDKRKYDLGARELVAALSERGAPVQFELVKGLSPVSSHTYPGFLGGKLVAERTRGMSEKELRRRYGWKNLKNLIDPSVQRLEHSLRFHSREFSRE